MKSISLSKFLDQMVSESDDWTDKITELVPEEKESFLKHIGMFKKHFLEYDSKKDCESSAHKSTE